MKNDTCAKCGSGDLIRIPYMPGEGPHIAVGKRLLQSVRLMHHVCGNCGFIETWVNEPEDLEKLREYYAQYKPKAE